MALFKEFEAKPFIVRAYCDEGPFGEGCGGELNFSHFEVEVDDGCVHFCSQCHRCYFMPDKYPMTVFKQVPV